MTNEIMFYAQVQCILIAGMIFSGSAALIMMGLILKHKHTK